MSVKAIRFGRFKVGAPPGDHADTPTAGQDDTGDGGFAALTPIAEPLSAGAFPDGIGDPVVSRVNATFPQRRVRCAANRSAAHPLDVVARPRFAISWFALTLTERDALLGFLRGTTQHGALGLTVYPDGRGDDGLGGEGEPITMRLLEWAADTQIDHTGYARGMEALYTVTAQAEEVFS